MHSGWLPTRLVGAGEGGSHGSRAPIGTGFWLGDRSSGGASDGRVGFSGVAHAAIAVEQEVVRVSLDLVPDPKGRKVERLWESTRLDATSDYFAFDRYLFLMLFEPRFDSTVPRIDPRDHVTR
jgi:hypothetical protein